jgi:hypothetical protein
MACITQQPEWSPEALKELSRALGKEPTAQDRFRALFDCVENITPVRDIARTSGRITEASLHKPGEVITLEDGRKYEIDEAGRWIRKP